MLIRIQAQFDHLAETYFDGFDYDLAERELGYLMALDLDLDMCSASLRLTKTAVEATINDKGACHIIKMLIRANVSLQT